MRDITMCHPQLQEFASKLLIECAKQGLVIKIGECFRTVAEQEALYAQGRTEPGQKVTNARGTSYSSQHQWGIAFDFYRADGKGAYYNDDRFFQKVGAIGKSIGLGWGGDWKSPVDMPHLYLPYWGSTTTKLKNQYGNVEAFKKTWGNYTSVTPAQTTGGLDMASLPTVKQGAKGSPVKALQILLNGNGCDCGTADGIAGSKTYNAIVAYQKKVGLTADGIAGQKTWAKILGV